MTDNSVIYCQYVAPEFRIKFQESHFQSLGAAAGGGGGAGFGEVRVLGEVAVEVGAVRGLPSSCSVMATASVAENTGPVRARVNVVSRHSLSASTIGSRRPSRCGRKPASAQRRR